MKSIKINTQDSQFILMINPKMCLNFDSFNVHIYSLITKAMEKRRGIFMVLVCIFTISITVISDLSGQNVKIGVESKVVGAGGYIGIKGNLINDGTFTNQNNTVVLNGSSQEISGDSISVFNNLTFSGTGIKDILSGTALTVNSSLVTGGMLVIESSSLLSNGSLIVKGTTTGTFTYDRQLLTEAEYGDYQFVSSPVGNNSATNAGKITQIYSWDEVNGSWPVESITNLVSGEGYNIDQTSSSDGLISFTGNMVTSAVINATSPYSDVITGAELNYDNRLFIDASGHSGIARSLSNYGGGGWNMLGNPFPSALLVSKFLEANYSSTPALSNFDPNYVAIYLYDGTVSPKGKYYYISNSSGWWSNELSQTHIQAGQGFFVLAMNDYSTFTFDRSMQDHAVKDLMLKSTKEAGRWPGLSLIVRHGDYKNSTLIIYHNGMTAGLDPGYDIGQLSTYPDLDIYTMLPESNGIRYMQHALPIDGCDSITLPVGVDFLPGGDVTFSSVSEKLKGYDFILEDRLKNVFTNISDESYTVLLPSGTSGTGRFFIHTKSSGTTNVEPNPDDGNQTGLNIWAADRTIYIKGNISRKAIVYVYSSKAELIYVNKLNEGSFNTFSLSNATKGIYFIKIIDDQKVRLKKVMIF
jgi:hypothetical protein